MDGFNGWIDRDRDRDSVFMRRQKAQRPTRKQLLIASKQPIYAHFVYLQKQEKRTGG